MCRLHTPQCMISETTVSLSIADWNSYFLSNPVFIVLVLCTQLYVCHLTLNGALALKWITVSLDSKPFSQHE